MQGFTIYFESRNIRRKHNFCKDVLHVRFSQRYFFFEFERYYGAV